ncbi:MAG: fluoride efflux transporter CrcB [Bacteroidia bacterium]
MTQQLLYIFIGGGLGSLARFFVGLGVRKLPESVFPFGTLAANILSCLIMGLALGIWSEKMSDSTLRYFVLIGICGGFSTFSTFSYESLELIRKGHWLWASLNIIVSVAACISILAFLTKKQPVL